MNDLLGVVGPGTLAEPDIGGDVRSAGQDKSAGRVKLSDPTQETGKRARLFLKLFPCGNQGKAKRPAPHGSLSASRTAPRKSEKGGPPSAAFAPSQPDRVGGAGPA